MGMSNESHEIEISKIIVPENRQRKKPQGIEELAGSIGRIGQINAIVITRDFVLVAGERRLLACIYLGWTKIYCRFTDELDPDELAFIELEENVRREELPWKEEALAFVSYCDLLSRRLGRDNLTRTEIANALNWSTSTVHKYITVGRELTKGSAKVEGATSLQSAFNLLQRAEERKVETELAQLDYVSIVNDLVKADPKDLAARVETEAPAFGTGASPVAQPPKTMGVEAAITQADFLHICSTYAGPKFNLVHCDFPYGVGMDESEQGGSASKTTYTDTPEIYFDLLNALILARDRLLMPSAHILFWFSMNFYSETKEKFEQAGFSVNPFPLIWHKTDLRGILPDPQRGGRRTYETALLVSQGDRKIVSPVAMSHAAPTARPQLHISQKPQPVLEHFFRMLVDENTVFLDPTCGSGTSLCAAEKLHSQSVTGWDLEPEFVQTAQEILRKQRALRQLETINV